MSITMNNRTTARAHTRPQRVYKRKTEQERASVHRQPSNRYKSRWVARVALKP